MRFSIRRIRTYRLRIALRRLTKLRMRRCLLVRRGRLRARRAFMRFNGRGSLNLYPRFLSNRISLRILLWARRTLRRRLLNRLRAFLSLRRFFLERCLRTFRTNDRTFRAHDFRCLIKRRFFLRQARSLRSSLAMILRFRRGKRAMIRRSRLVRPL